MSPALDAEVIAVEGRHVWLAPYAEPTGVANGALVQALGASARVAVGEHLVGEVLDGLGRSLATESGASRADVEWRALDAEPPPPLRRALVSTHLPIGIRAIDGMLTCGRGQRLGIFAAAGGGKSTLLAMMCQGAAADVIVLALIGERGREVREFIEQGLTPQARARTVCVVATSDRPALERMAEAVQGMLGPSLLIFVRFAGGLAVLLIVTTWLAMVLQVGALVAPEVIRPKYERIDPVAKAKQLFSMQSLFEFGKSLVKVVVLGLVFFYLIRQYTPSLAVLAQCGPSCGLALTVRLMFWLMAVLVIAYVVFGGLDFAYQKYQLRKQLMMSHDEIKRESKEVEGNREIKNKRREIHRETIESGSLSDNVKRSTAVVRNPTRLAICLRYVPGETAVPLVIEKGRHARARTIVRIAEREGIPVVEHVPVARRLMDDVEIDAPIPPDLFDAVAAILRLALDLPYEVQTSSAEDEAQAGPATRTPDGEGA